MRGGTDGERAGSQAGPASPGTRAPWLALVLAAVLALGGAAVRALDLPPALSADPPAPRPTASLWAVRLGPFSGEGPVQVAAGRDEQGLAVVRAASGRAELAWFSPAGRLRAGPVHVATGPAPIPVGGAVAWLEPPPAGADNGRWRWRVAEAGRMRDGPQLPAGSEPVALTAAGPAAVVAAWQRGATGGGLTQLDAAMLRAWTVELPGEAPLAVAAAGAGTVTLTVAFPEQGDPRWVLRAWSEQGVAGGMLAGEGPPPGLLASAVVDGGLLAWLRWPDGEGARLEAVWLPFAQALPDSPARRGDARLDGPVVAAAPWPGAPRDLAVIVEGAAPGSTTPGARLLRARAGTTWPGRGVRVRTLLSLVPPARLVPWDGGVLVQAGSRLHALPRTGGPRAYSLEPHTQAVAAWGERALVAGAGGVGLHRLPDD